MSHCAVRPIAADQPGRSHRLLAAVGMPQTRLNAVRRPGEADQLHLPLDLNAEGSQVRREEARARGKEELAASSLDAQFEALDALGDGAEIDARLARLKAGAA